MKIEPNETLIRGSWIERDQKVVADDLCRRIEVLIRDYLRQVGTSNRGWEHLYLDPSDDRLWELTYPHSDWLGGGPPTLRLVSAKLAEEKYRYRG